MQAFGRMWQILTNTNMPCVVPTGQNPGDNTNQESPEEAEMIAQPVKAPAAKPEHLCSTPQTPTDIPLTSTCL